MMPGKKLAVATLAAFCCAVFSCGTGKNKNAGDSEGINRDKKDSLREISSTAGMVKSFYGNYLATCEENPPERVKEINRLEKEHCSQECIDWLEKEEFEFDPFLDAQDCDTAWIRTLKVVPANGAKREAVDVSYDYDKGITNTIRLYITHANEAPKIDSISWPSR